MDVREIKGTLEGNVLQTSMRTLSEREMANVLGGGPIIVIDPNEGTTPTWCPIGDCCCKDDCQD